MLQDGTRLVAQVNPATVAGDFRSWDDANGNGLPDPSELGPPTRPYGGNVNKIDPNIARPYSDEVVLGLQHELAKNVTVGVEYFHRKNANRFSGINRAVPLTAYTSTQVLGPAGLVTVFNQDPATLGSADRIITNIPDLTDSYNGIEFSATKHMAGRWELLGSLTVGRDKGLYDSGLNDDFNNPNLNLYRQDAIIGQDSTYIGKLLGTFIFPGDVTASTNLRYFTGQPVDPPPQVTVRGLNQGTVSVRAEPRGQTRLDNVLIWDMRGSKVFTMGRNVRIEPMLDVFNLLNRAPKVLMISDLGPNFGLPLQILAPRIARLGLRITF